MCVVSGITEKFPLLINITSVSFLTLHFFADTVFIDNYKHYNVIVGMFHDQVLAPFKSLFKFKAINITLGLKYWRASPDHGVAINMIKKNKSNPSSLLECVYFFNNLK